MDLFFLAKLQYVKVKAAAVAICHHDHRPLVIENQNSKPNY